MKQTEYLNGVLDYYRECGITPGDPNEGRWEDAHTPYPRGMGESTVPLLHEHHVIHDLWQSEELGECHFYNINVLRVLNKSGFWPSSWFDLWEIYDELSTENTLKGRLSQEANGTGVFNPEVRTKGHSKSHETCRRKKIGVYAKETQKKGGKAIFEQGKGIFSPEVLGKGAKKLNSQIWECLVTGEQLPPGPLSCFQKKRGIDTKLRKRIK